MLQKRSGSRSPTRNAPVRITTKPQPKLDQNFDDSDVSLSLSGVDSLFHDSDSDSEDSSNSSLSSHHSETDTKNNNVVAAIVDKYKAKVNGSSSSADELSDKRESYQKRQLLADAVSGSEKGDQTIPKLLKSAPKATASVLRSSSDPSLVSSSTSRLSKGKKKVKKRSASKEDQNNKSISITTMTTEQELESLAAVPPVAVRESSSYQRRQMVADAVVDSRENSGPNILAISAAGPTATPDHSVSSLALNRSMNKSMNKSINFGESFQRRQKVAEMMESGIAPSQTSMGYHQSHGSSIRVNDKETNEHSTTSFMSMSVDETVPPEEDDDDLAIRKAASLFAAPITQH